jgi:hypothetical protein
MNIILQIMLRKYKNNSLLLIVIAATIASCFMTGCDRSDIWEDVTLTKSDYENILKREVDDLIAQSGLLEQSFLYIHGLPIWENSKWVNINSKDMLVVPLLSSNSFNKKHIIGVVKDRTISAVIVELCEADISKNKMFILSGELVFSVPRLKSNDEAQYLLSDGGSAQDLFAAANAGSTYNPNANAGTLAINAISSGTASSSNTSGHAWIEYTDANGNTTTFGTWGNQGDTQYFVNKEKEYTYSGASSYSVSITYSQFQNILNYNATSGNTNWSMTYNCAGYATGVWEAVTGTNIGGGIVTTPSHVQNWINNQ